MRVFASGLMAKLAPLEGGMLPSEAEWDRRAGVTLEKEADDEADDDEATHDVDADGGRARARREDERLMECMATALFWVGGKERGRERRVGGNPSAGDRKVSEWERGGLDVTRVKPLGGMNVGQLGDSDVSSQAGLGHLPALTYDTSDAQPDVFLSPPASLSRLLGSVALLPCCPVAPGHVSEPRRRSGTSSSGDRQDATLSECAASHANADCHPTRWCGPWSA